jgi:hypothetical protein
MELKIMMFGKNKEESDIATVAPEKKTDRPAETIAHCTASTVL